MGLNHRPADYKSLFSDAGDTAQREALLRWHMNVVVPLAKVLKHELREKLEADVRLSFDTYPLDIGGAASFRKMVQAGMSVDDAAAKPGYCMMCEMPSSFGRCAI